MVDRKIMAAIVRIFLWLSIFTVAAQCQLRKWIVAVVVEEPYIMLCQSAGNDSYEGFIVDLIDKISKSQGVDYELVKVDAIGSFDNTTGLWTGMIGEVTGLRADIAAGPITMTAEREGAVDFTAPFMELGISILYKRPKTYQRSGLDRFLDVFGPFYNNFPTTTFFVLALIFGIVLLVLRRKHKTIYFRVLLGVWLLFLVMFMSLYIARLSSFYVHNDIEYVVEDAAFQNIEDLSKQREVAYGGSTASFFRNAEHSTTYGKIWSRMEARDLFVSSNKEGVELVMRDGSDKFAFLAESTVIEYETARKCELTQIGGLLDSKGYGLVLSSGSTLRDILNKQILKLEEEGYLASLKRKWWHGENVCGDRWEPVRRRLV